MFHRRSDGPPRGASDALLVGSLRATALVAGAIVLFIVAFVVREAFPALRLGVARFASDAAWHPSEGAYGLLPMVAGTLAVTLGAVLVATPLGVLAAVFCNAYAPRSVARPYRRLLELAAGIPSVVYGFWGLVTLVPLIARVEPPGASLLAGIAIVGLMILPTVALIAEASLAAVPAAYLHGAAALGLTRFATTRRVLLPAARGGIAAGVFLATARALGETMAVLMVCGNVARVPRDLFDPVRTLTANIALEMAYATGDHRSALFATGLALLCLVVLLVAGAGLVGRGRVRA